MTRTKIDRLLDSTIRFKALNKLFKMELVRFIIIAGIYSAISFLVYVALLKFLPYLVAFTISYLTGILLSYYANSRMVFRVALHWKKLLIFRPYMWLAIS